MNERRKAENKKTLVSRRDFLVAGGAVIAAGALSACTPKTTTETVVSTVTNAVTNTKTATTTATVTGAPVTTTKTTTTTATVEKTYEVVSPLGERVVEMITMAPRLDTLAGKTICIHGSPDFEAPTTHPVIQQVLQQQFPTAKVIPYTDMPGWDVFASGASSQLAPFVAALKEKGANAVISGNGG